MAFGRLNEVVSVMSNAIIIHPNRAQCAISVLPYSRDDSAWGSIMIPICVVKNGDGPTALQHLSHTLEPEMIKGRVIIVPAFNYPASRAAKRTSPIDGGNLNRLFPGKLDGTVTEKSQTIFSVP